MAQRLTNLRVKFVSCVDDGANQLADIVLAKRNDVETKAANSTQETTMAEEKTVETTKAADPVDIAKIVAAEVEKARAADRADFQKKLDEANAEIAKAKQAADVEKNARETMEFTKRAKDEIPNLTGSDEEKGGILKTLANQLLKEDFDKVLALLKCGDAAMKKGFQPVGASGSGDSDPAAKLETLAKARAAEKHISLAKAKDQILQEQPELYKEMRDAERRVN